MLGGVETGLHCSFLTLVMQEHSLVRGLDLLSRAVQQADSAGAAELLKEAVPLLGNLLLKSTVPVQDACLSAAIRILHRCVAYWSCSATLYTVCAV